jgi:hypothetical protein
VLEAIPDLDGHSTRVRNLGEASAEAAHVLEVALQKRQGVAVEAWVNRLWEVDDPVCSPFHKML